MILVKALYMTAALLLALYGIQAGILSLLYLRHRHQHPTPPASNDWPTVTIQLPLYNELYVVKRLLRAVTRLRYPAGRLQIQVLDDSTDETQRILQREVARYREQGIHIELVHRTQRSGFKAGALREGMATATGELIAIFDADFLPPADFLLKTVPYFSADPLLGLVQTRWGHLNRGYSPLTQAQCIALDAHFTVEQKGRQCGGLIMSFNGTAGVWRRSCIEAAGGWSADTLCEDLDLSFRAHFAGWHFLYLPDVVTPAEVPPQMGALKRQQARWAQGTVQCLRKLAVPVLTAPLPLRARLMGLLHLGAYLAHPMTLLLVLCTLPLLLTEGGIYLPLAGVGIAGLFVPLMQVIGQRSLHKDWLSRLIYFPLLMLMGIGLSWKNTFAILKGLSGDPGTFARTPKFQITGRRQGWEHNRYALGLDWSNAGELFMMCYAGATVLIAIGQGNWNLVPFMSLYFFGFAFVALYDVAHRTLQTLRQIWEGNSLSAAAQRELAVIDGQQKRHGPNA